MHTLFHTVFGFCLWDLLALLVLILMTAVLAAHIVRQKRRQRALEKALAEKTRGARPGPTDRSSG